MVITILDFKSNEVVIALPAWLTDSDALKAAQEIVREAATDGKSYFAIDENGERIDLPSLSVPVKNPNVKFEGYVRDQLGDNLACFSGVFPF